MYIYFHGARQRGGSIIRRRRAPRRKARVTRGSGIMVPAAMALGSYMLRRKFKKRKRRR